MLKSGMKKIIDASDFNFHTVDPDSVLEVELLINLGSLEMKDQVNESFDDFIKSDSGISGNLFILSRIRLMLRENGILRLINTGPGNPVPDFLFRLEILLNKAGFINIHTVQLSFPLTITAVRRSVVMEDLGYGLILKEVIDQEGIARCHQFAKNFYHYKDFNYDLDVVNKFDLNCDHFAVFDENDKIYSLTRIVLRTPGYYCPFMYATLADDPDNGHFSVPGDDRRIGEIMAIYSAGKKGVVAFKKMMEYMTQYGTDIAHFDSVWTTYDEEDSYTGTYYKNKFMMDDTGVQLCYGDFGGKWNLLVTRKIRELKERHHQIFGQKQE